MSRRGVLPALEGLILAVATACHPSPPVSVVYDLPTTVDPSLHETHEDLLYDNVTCRWLEDGRLLAETRSSYAGCTYVHQVWIAFPSTGSPRVSLRAWNSQGSAIWNETAIEGRARISSAGERIGNADGPDLLVACEYRCMMSGSDKPGGTSFRLTKEQLVRHQGN